MKVYFRVIMAFVLFLAVVAIDYLPGVVSPVYGAGPVTDNITCTVQTGLMTDTERYWSAGSTGLTCSSVTKPQGGFVGWNTFITSDKWQQLRSYYQFDLSAITATSDIVDVKLWNQTQRSVSAGAPADWLTSYLSFYYTPDSDGVLATADWGNAYTAGSVMLFAPKTISSMTDGAYTWQVWQMYSGYFGQLLSMRDSNGLVNFTWATMRSMLNVSPTWYGNNKACHVLGNYGAGVSPYLQITYVSDAIERTVLIPANGAVNPLPTGSETADNITWYSPRLSYADEGMVLSVNGESGANVSVRLVSADGLLLASRKDSIRDNSHFYWSVAVLGSFAGGWVKAYEDNFNLQSSWGYVAPVPSASQKNLEVYAVSTEYPQYDNAFSEYVIYQNGMMFVHWKTNIQANEITDYGLEMQIAGDNVTGVIYQKTLSWLNSDYYQIRDNLATSNNTYLAAWRYAIFTPYINVAGFDNRDGAIINVDQPYTAINAGFWMPLIYNVDDDSVLTMTHSCYYYLSKLSDGVSISLDSNLKATITVGNLSKVPAKLSNLTIQVIDDVGQVVGLAYGSAIAGNWEVQLPSITDEGDYQVRFIFYDDTLSPYYSYIHDLPFHVGVTGVPGIVPGEVPSVSGLSLWIGGLLGRYNLDNEVGHWLVIFILCVILAAIFWKHSVVATVLVLLIFAGAFALGWINPWFIILLCLGAGLTIYGLIRKKTKTEGGA